MAKRPITLKGLRDQYVIPTSRFWARQDIWNSAAPNARWKQTIQLWPDKFPAGTTITWTWPQSAQPWCYPGIAWGNQEPGVVSPIAKKISDFKALQTYIDYSFSGSPGDMDILHEMWLYKYPLVSQQPKPIFEILVLMVPKSGGLPMAYFSFTITDPFPADIFFNPNTWAPSILIIPKTPMVGKTTVDWLAIFDQLTAQDLLTGDEYAYGFEFGPEVWNGSGSFLIKSFEVTWK